MHLDDMILVSVDDHVCEPPDMWHGRLAAKWRGPRAAPGPQARWHRRVGLRRPADAEHRRQRRRRTAARGVRHGADVARAAPRRVLRRRRPRRGHERERHPGIALLSVVPGLERRALQPAARQGARARDDRGLQRLAHRRLVRRLSRPFHPAGPAHDVGSRAARRRGAARGQEGLSRHDLLGQPGQHRLSEPAQRPLGSVLEGVLGRGHGGVHAHRVRERGCRSTTPIAPPRS